MDTIHISTDDILNGWKSHEHTVGRITNWGAHYIATIHNDVPDDERKEIADFIANAPDLIKKLKDQIDREGKLILKMKDDISFYKRKINRLEQKLESKKK